MSNIIKTAATAAFNNCWLPAVGGGVAVVNGDNSTQGIIDGESSVDQGIVFNVAAAMSVRVLADEIGTVEEDGELSVDGSRVFVSGVKTDAAGAITRISYTETRPVPSELA